MLCFFWNLRGVIKERSIVLFKFSWILGLFLLRDFRDFNIIYIYFLLVFRKLKNSCVFLKDRGNVLVLYFCYSGEWVFSKKYCVLWFLK